MVKTCKSSGTFGVAIHRKFSGERVRNTQAICLSVENSPVKIGVMLHGAVGWHHLNAKVGDRKA